MCCFEEHTLLFKNRQSLSTRLIECLSCCDKILFKNLLQWFWCLKFGSSVESCSPPHTIPRYDCFIIYLFLCILQKHAAPNCLFLYKLASERRNGAGAVKSSQTHLNNQGKLFISSVLWNVELKPKINCSFWFVLFLCASARTSAISLWDISLFFTLLVSHLALHVNNPASMISYWIASLLLTYQLESVFIVVVVVGWLREHNKKGEASRNNLKKNT